MEQATSRQSRDVEFLANENETTILTALYGEREGDVARDLGYDASWLSKWKAGALAVSAKVLARLGLRVVDAEAQITPPGYIPITEQHLNALLALVPMGVQFMRYGNSTHYMNYTKGLPVVAEAQ
ncbi:hypothetical protein [Serratia marcescens]|uniref:Uncharacterized protein n=1 Tax=Serratia marcescens TaxID=615 RepID=A0A9X8YS60_SERMA|nr:hypothetical protein [Serratia marcescens]MBS3894876.1 hypothetical protein [Serratia marcescens]